MVNALQRRRPLRRARVAAERHERAPRGRADQPDQHGKPMPEARQAEVGGHVVEFVGVARREKALPRQHDKNDDRQQLAQFASAPARCAAPTRRWN